MATTIHSFKILQIIMGLEGNLIRCLGALFMAPNENKLL
jgi:hypothetical protein